jgi:hypothetical protein
MDCVLSAAPGREWANVFVDGAPKLLDLRIAGMLAQARAGEPGLQMPHVAGRAA